MEKTQKTRRADKWKNTIIKKDANFVLVKVEAKLGFMLKLRNRKTAEELTASMLEDVDASGFILAYRKICELRGTLQNLPEWSNLTGIFTGILKDSERELMFIRLCNVVLNGEYLQMVNGQLQHVPVDSSFKQLHWQRMYHHYFKDN